MDGRQPPEDSSRDLITTRGEPAVSVSLDAPAIWAEFQLRGELGRGGFGRVYRAWDDGLAREIALKIIKVTDPTRRADALREGKMLARVQHRNVVTVHGVREVGDEIGFVMELVRGESLADLVRRRGPMGGDEAAMLGITLCQALAAVHGAGLLHRDIKAQNVMREAGGRIVLMDFGAGREVGPDEYADSGAIGTPLYMAPEILDGEPASHASDLYSLGVLLYFLLTQRYPVEGATL